MGKPTRDALVYREVTPDGSVWDIKRIALHRVAAHLQGGWILLITSEAVRDEAIASTYRDEIRKPFNPPR